MDVKALQSTADMWYPSQSAANAESVSVHESIIAHLYCEENITYNNDMLYDTGYNQRIICFEGNQQTPECLLHVKQLYPLVQLTADKESKELNAVCSIGSKLVVGQSDHPN